jgi:predicted transcriptional regulator
MPNLPIDAMTIDIPIEVYQKLAEKARKLGKDPQVLGCELLESALARETAPREAVREALQARGRLHPLGEVLRRRITPGISLDEVRQALKQAAGASLSEIVVAQRGPKV